MATLDELQAQLAALTQRVNEITAPPDDYYTHRFSGEEIDNAVDRVNATPGSGAITAGDIGAAPSGFGLGSFNGLDSSQFGGDLNNINKNCWYQAASGTLNCPQLINLSEYGYGIAFSRLGSELTQVHFFNGYISIRHYTGSKWLPWEYVNPQMTLGVEYRTIERYNGKPVYAKLVNFGPLPNGTSASVSHNCENVLDVIFGTLKNQDGSLLNLYPAIIQFSISRKIIVIRTNGDMSTNICTVRMKYTKTTD